MNMNMNTNTNTDMNPSYPHDILPPVSFHLWLSGRSIRVYSVSPILSGDFHPEWLAESLRISRPLPYPLTWFVYGEQAAVVNMIDLQSSSPSSYSTYYQYQPQEEEEEEAMDDETDGYENETNPYYEYSETVDEVDILHELNMNQINDSFQQASGRFVACSGLTKNFIFENLKVTKYHHKDEEESEICVVCQAEFENEEMVGMLQCRHRFHPECITEWLLHKNVCPLCKSEALKV